MRNPEMDITRLLCADEQTRQLYLMDPAFVGMPGYCDQGCSPFALSAGTIDWKENTNVIRNNFVDHCRINAARRYSKLASQPGMGIRPQWSDWYNFGDFDHSVAYGPTITLSAFFIRSANQGNQYISKESK